MTDLAVSAVVDHVYDGDTFVAACIPLGLGAGLVHVRVRIDGINAPELHTPEGDDAAAFAKTLAKPYDLVQLTSRGRLGRVDNYGRVLAAVTLPDGRDWGQVMVDAGHAERYTPASARVQFGDDEDI